MITPINASNYLVKVARGTSSWCRTWHYLCDNMDEVLSIIAPFYRLHHEDEDLLVFWEVRQISENSDVIIEIPENDLTLFIKENLWDIDPYAYVSDPQELDRQEIEAVKQGFEDAKAGRTLTRSEMSVKLKQNKLDATQALTVIERRYASALELLDQYDHGTMKRPKGHPSTYRITYEECREIIDSMRFGESSSLFGKEKDSSFKGSIGNIYQSFGGQDVYPTMEEKAANLLYFLTKNHSFLDGNKRIAATLFLYFLNQNHALFDEYGKKLIDDHTLATLTILVAESRSDEKETMINVILNCMGSSFAKPETDETFDGDYDSKKNGIRQFKQADQDLLNGDEMTLEEFIKHRGK